MTRTRSVGWLACLVFACALLARTAGHADELLAAAPAQAANEKAKAADEASKEAKGEEKAAEKKAVPSAEGTKAGEKEAKPAESGKAEAKKEAPAKKETTPKKVKVVRFTLSGSYPEGPASLGLLGEMETTLNTLIDRLDSAAKDDDVAAVWLRIEDLQAGRGKLSELRAAVARVRKAGKPVYAELGSAETPHYLLAAACDEVIMPPSGFLVLPGIRAEMMFYKGLLDKLGIQFDMLQMGKYKGAAEPYTRSNMSGPLRESFEAVVDDLYGQIACDVAAGRGMKDYQVKTLMDQGLFTAADAKKAGLVDRLLYGNEVEEALRKELKADEIEVVTKYKKKDLEAELSGFSGFMKLMEIMMGGKPSEAVSKKKKIAVVYAVGPIMEGKSQSDLFGESTIGSSSLVETLKKAADDPTVMAIVLRIDSPGGSAVASDLIWHETVRIEKPVIASMGDVAGSGGYYIAMGADQIFAEPGTITGSIGVVGGKMVLGGLFDKVGLSTEVISRGAQSGLFSYTAPFSPEERKTLNRLMQDIYRQFVGKAAQGRKMTYQELERLAQGRIYTGKMAADNGLIDRVGTLADAVAAAKKAAGLKADEELEIQILPRPKSILEQLFGDASMGDDLESAAPEAIGLLRQSRLWRKLFARPVVLWMPYQIEIK